MQGNRHRNMYYATGQPGFVRFGYSPGWAGRSASGLGPCAEYLRTGQWPVAQAPTPAQPTAPAAVEPGPSRNEELIALKAQAEALQQQLEVLNQRIGELAQPES